jgi:fused signal recognition particle receptor
MNFSLTIPTVWMIVGVNGVGKTSTIAKLAKFYSSKGKSVLLTAADTYRAAAFEQIDHYAKLLELPIVHHQRFSDPGAVVFDSLEKAIAKKIDIVLIDTAGRMHTSYNLMEELKKIKKVIYKKINRDADEILMVIDSTTGQNAKFQVDLFNQSINLTGIILTKTDGTSKGGIILTIKNEFNLPIKFITNGEKLENIQYFDSVKFTEMLFNQEVV